MEIKDLKKEDRPRERFERLGVKALADYEIMAIIIGSGGKNNSVLEMAINVINQIDLKDFEHITIRELEKIKGIGHITAMRIMASLELARRVRNQGLSKNKILYSKDVYNLLKEDVEGYEQEHFIAIYLDAKCQVISQKTIFIGTTNMTITHPREVFKHAVRESANAIIIVHNHPSGCSKPSLSDIDFTKKVFRLGQEMQIELIDHISIGRGEFYSMKEHNIF